MPPSLLYPNGGQANRQVQSPRLGGPRNSGLWVELPSELCWQGPHLLSHLSFRSSLIPQRSWQIIWGKQRDIRTRGFSLCFIESWFSLGHYHCFCGMEGKRRKQKHWCLTCFDLAAGKKKCALWILFVFMGGDCKPVPKTRGQSHLSKCYAESSRRGLGRAVVFNTPNRALRKEARKRTVLWARKWTEQRFAEGQAWWVRHACTWECCGGKCGCCF